MCSKSSTIFGFNDAKIMQNERITKFITTFLRVFFLFVSQCQRKPLSLEKNLRTLGTIRTVNPMNECLFNEITMSYPEKR